MTEIINNIVNTTINSFDITFCIIVNIATYILIKLFTKRRKLTTWNKRIVLIVVSILIAIVYCLTGSDYRTIFNSLILAPVSWSWIFKPICNAFKIDYNTKRN